MSSCHGVRRVRSHTFSGPGIGTLAEFMSGSAKIMESCMSCSMSSPFWTCRWNQWPCWCRGRAVVSLSIVRMEAGKGQVINMEIHRAHPDYPGTQRRIRQAGIIRGGQATNLATMRLEHLQDTRRTLSSNVHERGRHRRRVLELVGHPEVVACPGSRRAETPLHADELDEIASWQVNAMPRHGTPRRGSRRSGRAVYDIAQIIHDPNSARLHRSSRSMTRTSAS